MELAAALEWQCLCREAGCHMGHHRSLPPVLPLDLVVARDTLAEPQGRLAGDSPAVGKAAAGMAVVGRVAEGRAVEGRQEPSWAVNPELWLHLMLFQSAHALSAAFSWQASSSCSRSRTL